MQVFHDPTPDGRTGPFLRIVHRRNPNGGLLWDERCDGCWQQCPEDGEWTCSHAREYLDKRERC